jgi:regulator of sirC expression with transglutaminase-like and TPR domain
LPSPDLPDFATLASLPGARLDELALAIAAEFRSVSAQATLDELDELGAELAKARPDSPREQAEACRRLLGERERFTGNREDYDHPDNSMLDLVLARRKGLPILLSVVYVEVARRARIPLEGVGLPGHYVVGHFGTQPPLLLDPFAGGAEFALPTGVPPALVRPWGSHETALRMLHNLTGTYATRGDLGRAIRASRLRLLLPLDELNRETLSLELRRLEARLN